MDGFIDRFTGRKQDASRTAAQAEARERQEHSYRVAMEEIRKCSAQNTRNAEAVNELLRKAIATIHEAQRAAGDGTTGADPAEVAKLRESLEETVNTLEEMLGAGLRNMQNTLASNIAVLQQDSEEKIAALTAQQEKLAETVRAEEAENRKAAADNKTAILQAVNESGSESREFFHKESVKVYRNVQAVVEAETAKQTEALSESVQAAVKEATETMASQVAEKVGEIHIGKGLMPVAVITMLAALCNAAALICHLFGLI